MKNARRRFTFPFLLAVLGGWVPAAHGTWTAARWEERVREDWLVSERLRADARADERPSTGDDAAGGVDGVKSGEWGFHTARTESPWWQVDLGSRQEIFRVVLWNRRESADRVRRLQLLVSDDGKDWRMLYRHDDSVFGGGSDHRPLDLFLEPVRARWLRVRVPGENFLHLDEIEVFGTRDPGVNLALHRSADQSSTSEWSRNHRPVPEPDWAVRAEEVLSVAERLAEDVPGGGEERDRIRALRARRAGLQGMEGARDLFLEARGIQRRLALAHPLLGFDEVLFTKRLPSSFSHMSDQYYGWWSQPGGGIYRLRGFRSGVPTETCLTESFREPGTFLRPTLSYDGTKVLFAWCRFYAHLAGETNKLDKAQVPEDAFFHLFEMNLDGSDVRRLTRGKYDDFDGRYLPDGRIVFLSTRRGASLQAGRESARRTTLEPDRPDCYVRCGGGPERPVAVYTLHTMAADGTGLTAISPFEMFEWTPEIGADGSILYSRWDYIDRDNMPYMGLWSISPDGANARIVYGNYTKAPHCTFEPKPVPGSRKIVFTASAHHAQTMGSLVLLDPSVGTEGTAPIRRLTPEVPFPEIEGWPRTYYANPWPLSERLHLVAWGYEGASVPGPNGWDRWYAVQRPRNGMALYLFDAEIGRELLHADPDIACGDPIPIRPRPVPPALTSSIAWEGPREGRFFLGDVYRGLKTVSRGEIKALRIVAVPPKTHPTMNYPELGVTRDDPGKCVLGTVPVEPDGSAFFRVPSGVILFFQALDERGQSLQTMRSVTHVQPGQTLGCTGCHEGRNEAPASRLTLAARREPSRIQPGPEGSWTMDYSRLVQPVLDAKCVSCHSPGSRDPRAAAPDLTPHRSWESLTRFGKPSLQDVVWAGYRRGYSIEREGPALGSALLRLLDAEGGHAGAMLSPAERERFVIWMDAYAQRRGTFDELQENDLEQLRRDCAPLLAERGAR